MSGTYLLRVVWPIHDDDMFNTEAITAAFFDWPRFVDRYQVEPTETPRMRVIDLDDRQRMKLRANRAVVCEATVISRTHTTTERTAA